MIMNKAYANYSGISVGKLVLSLEDLNLADFSNLTWAASWQNQQYGLCAQWRLRSAWASAQSDQSLRWLHEEALGP